MRFNTIFILSFLIQGFAFAEGLNRKGCETSDRVCLKKMAQENMENGDSETYLKISILNCLLNDECLELNQGIPEKVYRDADSPDIYKAINNFLKTEMPILRQEKLKNEELIRESQKDFEKNFNLEEEIKRNELKIRSLKDSLKKVSSSKNKMDSIKEEYQKRNEALEKENKELFERLNKVTLEISGLKSANANLTSLNLKYKNETGKVKSEEGTKSIDENVPRIFIASPAAKSFYEYAKGKVWQLLLVLIVLILVLIVFIIVLGIFLYRKSSGFNKLSSEFNKLTSEFNKLILDFKEFLKHSGPIDQGLDRLKKK